jgi:hypothetical protein
MALFLFCDEYHQINNSNSHCDSEYCGRQQIDNFIYHRYSPVTHQYEIPKNKNSVNAVNTSISNVLGSLLRSALRLALFSAALNL